MYDAIAKIGFATLSIPKSMADIDEKGMIGIEIG